MSQILNDMTLDFRLILAVHLFAVCVNVCARWHQRLYGSVYHTIASNRQ